MPREHSKIQLSQSTGKSRRNWPKFKLDAQQINTLRKVGKIQVLEKGGCLLAIGSVPDAVYILNRGTAELVAKDVNDRLYSIGSVERREVIGLTEVIANAPCGACLRCVTDCSFTVIPRSRLIGVLHGEPDICFAFVSMVARALTNNLQATARRKTRNKSDLHHQDW